MISLVFFARSMESVSVMMPENLLPFVLSAWGAEPWPEICCMADCTKDA